MPDQPMTEKEIRQQILISAKDDEIESLRASRAIIVWIGSIVSLGLLVYLTDPGGPAAPYVDTPWTMQDTIGNGIFWGGGWTISLVLYFLERRKEKARTKAPVA
jgi:hypothetical protein